MSNQKFVMTSSGHRLVISPKSVKYLNSMQIDTVLDFACVLNLEPVDLQKIELESDHIAEQNLLVDITEADRIVYLKRKKYSTRSKFVLFREPEITNKISYIIKKRGNEFHLLAAYFGPMAEKDLEDPTLTDEEYEVANEFWKTRAFVIDYQLTEDLSFLQFEMPE